MPQLMRKSIWWWYEQCSRLIVLNMFFDCRNEMCCPALHPEFHSKLVTGTSKKNNGHYGSYLTYTPQDTWVQEILINLPHWWLDSCATREIQIVALVLFDSVHTDTHSLNVLTQNVIHSLWRIREMEHTQHCSIKLNKVWASEMIHLVCGRLYLLQQLWKKYVFEEILSDTLSRLSDLWSFLVLVC